MAHTFANLGGAPTRLLELDAPGGFEGYFAELAAAFPAGAAIEPATVAATQWRYDTYPPGTWCKIEGHC
jgi:hypothetical protein